MKKSGSVSKIIAKLLRALRPESSVMFWGFVALILGSAVNLLIPQFFRYLLTPVGQENFKAQPLYIICALLATFGIQALCFYYRSFFFGLASHRFVHRVRNLAFEKLLHQPLSYFAKNNSGDLIARLSGDLVIVQDLVNFKLSILLRYSLQVVAASILMLTLSFKLTLALLLVLPALVITSIIFGRRLKRLTQDFQAEIGSAMSLAQESITDLKSTKTYCAENFLLKIYSTHTQQALAKGKERSKFSAFFQSSISLLLNVSIVLLIIYGFYLVNNGGLILADLLTFIMYAGIVAVSFALAASGYAEMSQASGAAERVFELLDLEITANKEPIDRTSSESKNSPVNIAFKNVFFSYPNNPEQEILHNLSFDLSPGRATALIGLSGSGKSTIASLLLGLYQPGSGEILLNGKNLNSIDKHELYSQVAFVPQEPTLFNFSIADNLRIAAPDASDEKLWQALQAVNLFDHVKKLPEQLDTLCGERGNSLSMGQRQRISLARAILKDPQLLVLDEANSALDSENEALVYSSLEKFFKTRTTLIITHKFSTLANLDNILVLDKKTIVQQGSHTELLSQNGLYKTLAELQGI